MSFEQATIVDEGNMPAIRTCMLTRMYAPLHARTISTVLVHYYYYYYYYY